MAIIGFGGQVRILISVLFVDIILNITFPSVRGPLAATSVLGAMRVLTLAGVIAAEYVVMSKSLYVKAGSWSNVLKLLRLFVACIVLHLLFMVYIRYGHHPYELWTTVWYWFLFIPRRIISVLYYFVVLRHVVEIASDKVFYPALRADRLAATRKDTTRPK